MPMYAAIEGLYMFTAEEFDALHKRAMTARRGMHEQILHEEIIPYKRLNPEQKGAYYD